MTSGARRHSEQVESSACPGKAMDYERKRRDGERLAGPISRSDRFPACRAIQHGCLVGCAGDSPLLITRLPLPARHEAGTTISR